MSSTQSNVLIIIRYFEHTDKQGTELKISDKTQGNKELRHLKLLKSKENGQSHTYLLGIDLCSLKVKKMLHKILKF